MTLAVSAGLLVALALLAAGCGGDTRRAETEVTSAATQPAPTRPQGQTGGAHAVSTSVTNPARRRYVSRVDRICGRLDPERSAEQRRVGESTTTQEATKTYEDTIALGGRQLRQIEAVSPPPSDRAAVRANLIDVIKRQLDIRRQIRGALGTTNVAELRRLRQELDNLTLSLVGWARGYGFRVCGED
jgi:hypothetical protein